MFMSAASGQPRAPGYHSPLRARQAAQTRRLLISAACRLFGERGWAGTTLAAVAAEAGTAVETVYSGFGSKAGLLVAAIDVAIAGGEDETPLAEQAQFASLGTGARAERLSAAARIITQALVRAVPLMKALQEAAAGEETARARLERYETDRRATVAAGLELILGRPAPEALVDSLWALAGPEVFTKLTGDRRWTVQRYEGWLVDTAAAILGGVE
jgi:AcrR family transcriptional regulator